MKKILLSAAVLMGAAGICVSNFSNTASAAPLDHHNYIVRDTTPTDTTKPKDSTLLLKK